MNAGTREEIKDLWPGAHKSNPAREINHFTIGDETSAINAVDKQWTTPRQVFGGFCILDPSIKSSDDISSLWIIFNRIVNFCDTFYYKIKE